MADRNSCVRQYGRKAVLKMFVAFTIFLACNLAPDSLVAADNEIIEAVKISEAALDNAFVKRDYETLKNLTTQDHVSVTPSYGRPLNTQEQLDTLAEIKLKILSRTEPKITVLGPNTVLLQQEKRYSGTFNGQPMPKLVYATAVWSKLDGEWRERFYQETAITDR